METLVDFLSLQDPNVRYVVVATVLLAASSAIVGCFTVLRKRSLVGDAVAHAVLPGVCLSFMLLEWLGRLGLDVNSRNPLVLMCGALVSSWLCLSAIDTITRHSRIKEDTAIGLSLSVFFGIGIMLLTTIQHSGSAAQSGLDHFLFGKAAALLKRDVIVFAAVGLLLVGTVQLLFKEFTLLSFDRDFARAAGLPVRALEVILTTLTVLAVVIGIQAVGVVLMAAMLITPAAAGRYWTENIRHMVWLAALFAALSGVAGAYISYVRPQMPTGPWIVLFMSFIMLLSLLLAPRRGVLARYRRAHLNRRRIRDENILKAFFHVGEADGDFRGPRTIDAILRRREMPSSQLKTGLSRLLKQGYVTRHGEHWHLTPEGLARGRRMTRLHRLWEVYLTQYVGIAADHVHDDAETIEHILTPELERELEILLDKPLIDPHAQIIPER